MRPLTEVALVLHLREQGLGARRIAKVTGIPVRNAQEWLTDPDRALDRTNFSGMECSGRCHTWVKVSRGTYAYVLGLYLGDGYIIRQPRTFKLQIFCDQRYGQIIEEVESSLNRLIPRSTSRVQREGCIAVTSHSQHWPCMLPHGRGLKHQRRIVLECWQHEFVRAHPERFLRGLLQSDGCRVINRVKRPVAGEIKEYTYLRYFFSNASPDILQMFRDACDQLGIRWRQAGPRNISINHQSDIALVDTFVGPKR